MWLLLLGLVFPVYGAQCRHSSIRLACVEYVDNYDGDTITVNIPRVFHLFGDSVRIRVSGINTPEISSVNACEREVAKKAKQKVREMLTHAKRIDLVYPKRDKYFRILADVQADGVSVGETLMQKGWAVAYHGEAKPRYNWCRRKQSFSFFMHNQHSDLPYDPYQGEWTFSGQLEPSLHAHNVNLYLNNQEARERLKQYIADGYLCERRLGLSVRCRKLLDVVELPSAVQEKMNLRAKQMSVKFDPYAGGGSLITEGESYREWNIPAVVYVNNEKYDSYVFSKSGSGVIKVMMGYEDKQKTHYSFVANRAALKYKLSVAVEDNHEWHEYSAFAVFQSVLTE